MSPKNFISECALEMTGERVLSEVSAGIDSDDYPELIRQYIAETIKGFRKNRKGKQPWSPASASRVIKIWSDYAKTGIVRDEKGMADIANTVLRNVMKLYANTILVGHTGLGVEDMAEEAEVDPIQKEEEEDFYDYIPHDAFSDYAFDKYYPIWEKLAKAKEPEQQLLYVDQMFNVFHMRGDISRYLIQGGVNTLDKLAEVGERVEA